MSTLSSALETFLTNEGWNFTNDDEKQFHLGINGANGSYKGYFVVDDPKLYFYFNIPYNIPENKRQAICEYICRANYGLYLGNFEMDMSDGELRYKTSVNWAEDAVPSDEMFHALIYLNATTVDKYFTGVNAVVYGGISPEKAVADVEA
jgi:Family of unknown function (DUF1790).